MGGPHHLEKLLVEHAIYSNPQQPTLMAFQLLEDGGIDDGIFVGICVGGYDRLVYEPILWKEKLTPRSGLLGLGRGGSNVGHLNNGLLGSKILGLGRGGSNVELLGSGGICGGGTFVVRSMLDRVCVGGDGRLVNEPMLPTQKEGAPYPASCRSRQANRLALLSPSTTSSSRP